MIHKLSQWLYGKSKGWVVICSLALFVVFGAIVLPSQSVQSETYNDGVGSPDTSLFYSPANLYVMAETY